MARDDVETFVYILEGAPGRPEPLYVGVTDKVSRRFRQHAADKDWWPMVERRTFLSFPDRTSALVWEAALIEALRAQFNRTGDFHLERKRELHDGIELVADLLGMPE